MSDDWRGYLSDADLDKVRLAAIEAGLTTSDSKVDALLSGMRPLFAGNLAGGGLPANARILVHLRELNRVHNLRNGDVPLVQWLESAIALAGDRVEVDVFEAALDTVTQIKVEPPALAARVAIGPANFDLQPEAQVAGSDETVRIAFLESALASAKSVVKVLVHRHEGGHPVILAGDEPRLINGTGWFIAPQLLITNHHVINARRSAPVPEPDASPTDFELQAENTTVLFDYLKRDAPSATVVSGAGALLASDKALDFAILRIADPAAGRSPLRLRKHLIRKTVQQALGTRVNLLQHPNGQPMRLGFRDNFVVVGDDIELSYLTDTSVGSSGSPVCDDRWSVVALHSGSRRISAQGLEIRGKKVKRENHGIPIPTILKHLKDHHINLYEEIKAGQA